MVRMVNNNNVTMSRDDILNALLDTAEKDLYVSRELYNKGYYAPSIFYLQQGVEKLNKYLYGRIYTNLNENELENLFKKIGHNFTKSVREAIIKLDKQLKRLKTKDSNASELELYLEQFTEKLDMCAESTVDFNLLKESLDFIDTRPSYGMNLTLSELSQIKSFKNYYDYSIDSVYLIKNIKSILKAFSIQFFFDKYDLINTTRYPTMSNQYASPYKYYNKDNELVKEFNYILEQLSKILKDLRSKD